MQIDPLTLDASQRYKLLIGAIVPRPVALVSTLSSAGVRNLAPFSFFAGVGSNPMMLLFCPANKPDGTEKDTLRNAKPEHEGGMGEFVVNTVPASIAARMAACAEPLSESESEFDLSGLTPMPSAIVRPPRVEQSPVAFECVTRQVIRTNGSAPGAGNIVLGEVVAVYVRDDAVNERLHIDPARVDAIGRMGGTGYCYTRDRFELPMGRAALRTGPHPS